MPTITRSETCLLWSAIRLKVQRAESLQGRNAFGCRWHASSGASISINGIERQNLSLTVIHRMAIAMGPDA
jgi:hypothetical protein